MKCARCDNQVGITDRPQPTRLAGFTKPWPTLCDDCLRSHSWAGGSAAALAKLVDGGDADLGARARLAGSYPSPFAGMGQPDFRKALRQAAASGFVIPEAAR